MSGLCPICSAPIGSNLQHWHPEHRALTDGRRLVTLTDKQARVFDVLWLARFDGGRGRWIRSAIDVGEASKLSPLKVATVINNSLRSKVRAVGLIIDGQKGPGGGYFLKVDEGRVQPLPARALP